jgi:hypothetical protein
MFFNKLCKNSLLFYLALFPILVDMHYLSYAAGAATAEEIAFPSATSLLIWLQHPARVTWRLLSKGGGCRPLKRFYGKP